MSAFALWPTVLWLFFCIVPRSLGLPPPGSTFTFPLYSTVAIFGDSYSDDYHREEPLENPYKAMPEKTIMWPTFFMDMLPQVENLTLYNYAYNGAHANNKLTFYGTKHIPDTREQIAEFTTQLEKGEFSFGDEQTLIVIWIGINPVNVIWIETFSSPQNGGSSPSFETALDRVDKVVTEIENQLHHLRSDILPMRKNSTDFLLINAPHMDLAPAIKDLANKWSDGDAKRMTEYLEHLVMLIERFNTGLRGVAERNNHSEGDKQAGTVKMCDVVPIFDRMLKEGSQYGLTNTTGPCWENNVICSNPEGFAFWDTIHMMPKVEKILADWILKFIYTVKE